MRRQPAFDRHPARDDSRLRAVVEDAAMGRWEGARELLAATGRSTADLDTPNSGASWRRGRFVRP
ncbi:hypothetical protein ACTPOK_39985 [Streptomyces inhibens]|uniref:hypothetical protein n=1 Tax=Streptomyces inhibens TaxID=2293571 RepID=UPI00402ADA07